MSTPTQSAPAASTAASAKALSSEEASLRGMGTEADESEGNVSASDDEETASTDSGVKPEEAEQAGEVGAKDGVKPLSPYEQAKAGKKEREARAWQKIEAEKAALKSEKAALEAEKAALKSEDVRQKPAAEPLRDKNGYSARDFEQAATKFLADGEDHLAAEAKQAAQGLRKAEGEHVQRLALEAVHRGIHQALDKRPEFKDPASGPGQELIAILNEFPRLREMPGGLSAAIGILDGRKGTNSAQELRNELASSKKEVERLTRLTSLPGSNPTRLKSQAETRDKGESELRRMAAEADDGE